MKIKDVGNEYGISQKNFESFLNRHPEFVIKGVFGNSIDDRDVDEAVELYKQEKAAMKRQAEEAAMEQLKKQQAISKILVSSGYSFDGFRIVKYSGYISGDDVAYINRDELFDNNGQNITDSLVMIRIQALKELKEAAYTLGCNAIIGVDFDYITLEPHTVNSTGGLTYQPYVVCVTANGNAVLIEKE